MGPGPTHPLPNYFWIFGIFLTLQSPLGHVERKTEKDVVMITWNMKVGSHRKIVRPKLRWSGLLGNDMEKTHGKYNRSTRPDIVLRGY